MKKIFRGLAVAAVAGTAAVAMANPAAALDRRSVCAQDVWVRSAPGSGPIAILYQGETFDYDHSAVVNGLQWAYGFAWGGENTWGWLEYSTITNSHGQC